MLVFIIVESIKITHLFTLLNLTQSRSIDSSTYEKTRRNKMSWVIYIITKKKRRKSCVFN